MLLSCRTSSEGPRQYRQLRVRRPQSSRRHGGRRSGPERRIADAGETEEPGSTLREGQALIRRKSPPPPEESKRDSWNPYRATLGLSAANFRASDLADDPVETR